MRARAKTAVAARDGAARARWGRDGASKRHIAAHETAATAPMARSPRDGRRRERARDGSRGVRDVCGANRARHVDVRGASTRR